MLSVLLTNNNTNTKKKRIKEKKLFGGDRLWHSLIVVVVSGCSLISKFKLHTLNMDRVIITEEIGF